jgi:hypothetical protein
MDALPSPAIQRGLECHRNSFADCDLPYVGAYLDHLTRSIHERHDRVGHTRILTGGDRDIHEVHAGGFHAH